MNPTPQVRVGVGVFVWKDTMFLMGKRLGSHGSNTWSVPGGHLEFGETISNCAVREVLEETGLDVHNIRQLAVTEDFFADDDKQYITIWVEADWLSGQPTITEPEKWVDQNWFTFKTLPQPLFEPCWQNLQKLRPDLFTSERPGH